MRADQRRYAVGLLQRKKLRYVVELCFVLAVVAFWWVMLASRWRSLTDEQWVLPPMSGGLAVLGFTLYYLMLGAGWTFIARATGHRIPLGAGLGVWLLSTPARYIPGKVWHIVTRIRLAQRIDVSAPVVLVSSTLEQALIVLSATCAGLILVPWALGTGRVEWSALIILACAFGMQPPVLRFMVRLGSRLFGKPPLSFDLDYRRTVLLFLWYTLAALANGTAFFLMASMLSPGSNLGWVLLSGTYSVAYVIGYVSIVTPSGIGVREAALTSILALYCPVQTAITISLLARALSVAGEAVAVLTVGLPLAAMLRGNR